ncbi:MAG: MATE family efflux transporter [Treponema sp.]|jgi:putative MATE family efflux protein|nr:MATE family efflux transporter [Treponema sp.]
MDYSLTEGGILKKLLLIAMPIMGTQFIQMAYNLTDMFWLGRVGSSAVAASGAAGMYMWLAFGFLLIGRMGAEIGVSQFLGRGDRKTALAFSRNAMCIALALGTLFGLVTVLFNRGLIGFFRFREEAVAAAAAEYLFIVGFPMPLVFAAAVAVGTYNASGNSRTPFILNGIGLVLNVILDPLFILVLGMGVKGAAVATVISQLAAGGLMLAALIFFRDRPFEAYTHGFAPDQKKILALLKWAVPIGIESILFCFLSMVTSRIETAFGAHVVATSKIGSQVESLSWLIGGGFGSALVAFIGQNYGAEKWDRIHRGVRISALIMSVWGIFVSVFLFVWGGLVFSLFLPAPELVFLGRRYMRILAFCQLTMNLEAVGAGAFKGTGRTIQPSLVSVITNVIKPVLAFFLSRTELGLYGVWIAVTATAILRGTWICLWYIAAERRRKSATSPHRNG